VQQRQDRDRQRRQFRQGLSYSDYSVRTIPRGVLLAETRRGKCPKGSTRNTAPG
jgi:hypothetical protein